MNTWIAKLIDDKPITPPTCVAPGVAPEVAANAMNMGAKGIDWRVITEEERIELQKPSASELTAQLDSAIKQHLDDFAKQNQYDDMNSARLAAMTAGYERDGLKANKAYNDTWHYAISYLYGPVAEGKISVEDAIKELPKLSW